MIFLNCDVSAVVICSLLDNWYSASPAFTTLSIIAPIPKPPAATIAKFASFPVTPLTAALAPCAADAAPAKGLAPPILLIAF